MSTRVVEASQEAKHPEGRAHVHMELPKELHRRVKSAVALSPYGTLTKLTEALWRRWLLNEDW